MPLNVSYREEAGNSIVSASGEVDLYSSPAMREAILKGVKTPGGLLAIELHAVPYMDSSGVATLIEGLKAAGAAKKAFVLLAPSEQVLRILKLAKLDSVFDIREAL